MNRGAEGVDAFLEGVESGNLRRGCSSPRVVLDKRGRSIDNGYPRDTVVCVSTEDVISCLLRGAGDVEVSRLPDFAYVGAGDDEILGLEFGREFRRGGFEHGQEELVRVGVELGLVERRDAWDVERFLLSGPLVSPHLENGGGSGGRRRRPASRSLGTGGSKGGKGDRPLERPRRWGGCRV